MGVWVLMILVAGDPNEWTSFPTGKPSSKGGVTGGGSKSAPAASTTGAIPDGASARYRDAVEHVGAGRYQEATLVINQLTTEYPRVAELYATRCSAQLGLKQPQYAEVDCAYALKLKPTLSMAMYGLASAEEAQGKRELAARHFREYQRDPGARADLKEQAGKRAEALSGGSAAATPPPPPPPPAVSGTNKAASNKAASAPARSATAQCRTGNDGRQACGYNCDVGSDGVAACADTPDGTCSGGADGHVTCTQLAVRGGANAGGRPPECRTGTDGVKVCGYNCKKGTNGRYFCAAMPEGECTPNANGTYTCP